MRILYFIKGLGLGGAERHLIDCAVASRDAGHEVHVAYLLPHKDHFVPELVSAGVPVEQVGNNPLAVFRYLRKVRPDVVHAHLPVPSIYSRLFKPILKYGLVVTHHNMFHRQKASVRLGERLTHRLDDAGISCSAEVASSLPWQTEAIDNGIRIVDPVDPPAGGLRGRLGLNDRAVIVLCIANLVAKKNHALLCRAFAEMRAQTDLDCHCVLIGQDGTEREKLERLVDELGCADRIHFWGADPDASLLASDADIFCLPSNFEGLPLSLLEAMSVGLPAVVTDAGGMPDVVEDGVHGRVVSRGDQQGLARALAELAGDEQLRARFGEQARRHVSANYNANAMFDRLAPIYARVDAERKRR